MGRREAIHRDWEEAIELGSNFLFALDELRSITRKIRKRRRHGGDPAADERRRGAAVKQVVRKRVRE